MDAARIVMSGMWLQDDSISSGNSKLLLIFVGIVALSMLIQAIVFIVAAVLALKARKKIAAIVDEVRQKTMPILESTTGIIRDLQPKVKVITENLVETSHLIRAKAHEFESTAKDVNQTVADINQKTRAQADRVDGMISSILNSTSQIATTIERGIKIPVREVSGIVNGLKAGLDVLVGRTKGFGKYSSRQPGNGYREDDIGI